MYKCIKNRTGHTWATTKHLSVTCSNSWSLKNGWVQNKGAKGVLSCLTHLVVNISKWKLKFESIVCVLISKQNANSVYSKNKRTRIPIILMGTAYSGILPHLSLWSSSHSLQRWINEEELSYFHGYFHSC